MKYKAQHTIYIVLFGSFVLLLLSLMYNYKSISTGSKLLKELSESQIKLSYYTNQLNYTVKKNQADILTFLVLQTPVDMQKLQNNAKQIHTYIQELKKFSSQHQNYPKAFREKLKVVEKRALAYELVQKSLFEALKERQNEDIQDAIWGFDLITQKFSQDLQALNKLAKATLSSQIYTLLQNNKENLSTLIFSFITAFLLIIIAVVKFNSLNNKISTQLAITQKAQSELKEAQEKLIEYNENLEEEIEKKTQEIHDKIYANFLSGLPNRNKLLEDISRKEFSKIAIINIDNFQSFNDVYGEKTGNIALQQTAQWLQNYVKNDDLSLYHLSGDEFALACVDTYHAHSYFIAFVEKMLSDYKNTNFRYDGKEYRFVMSAGVALSGKKKMLAYADMALKDAKKRNIPLAIFEEDKNLEQSHKDDIEIYKKILEGFEHNRLVSYFQPIVPIQDYNKNTKYESLIRLIDSDGSVIPPFKFLRVAKANRVYYKITKRVIDNTLSTIQRYSIPCSLNLSLTDIKNERTKHYLFSKLDSFGFNELLTIELLETEDFDNYKEVHAFCMDVRSYGVKVALDDFGSGYSNFSHILNLPVDFIKIDATLISNIDRDISSQIMVETIVSLARKLKVETIAEFVASEDILEMVKMLGVDYAQGYHLGKPLDIKEYMEKS